MRWFDPALGARRARSGFLFFPKWIFGEWRWLEYARWVDENRGCGWMSIFWQDD
jgi:hypothetical protein